MKHTSTISKQSMIKKYEMCTHIYIYNLGFSACFSLTISAIHIVSSMFVRQKKSTGVIPMGSCSLAFTHTRASTQTHTHTQVSGWEVLLFCHCMLKCDLLVVRLLILKCPKWEVKRRRLISLNGIVGWHCTGSFAVPVQRPLQNAHSEEWVIL